MRLFTVIVQRPDFSTYIAHAKGNTWEEAAKDVQDEAHKADHGEYDHEDYDVLAVFDGWHYSYV